MLTFTTDDGADLAYELHDFRDPWLDGPPRTVLLHHGFIRNRHIWQPWVPGLARHHQVVRYDVRGCGDSRPPGPGGDFSCERLAQDALELLDHLDIDRIDFIGHLSGALVGEMFAVRHPERVRSLTLVAGPAVVNDPIRGQYALGEEDSLASMRRFGLREWLRRTNTSRFDPTTDPRIIDWHFEQQARTPLDIAYALHAAFREIDMRAELERITVPVLLLSPTDAPGLPPDQQLEMQRRIPDARLVTLEGRGSDLPLAQADRCVEEVLAFLRDIEQADLRQPA